MKVATKPRARPTLASPDAPTQAIPALDSKALRLTDTYWCARALHQLLSMAAAVIQSAQELGTWQWTSNDHDDEPDVIIKRCGGQRFIDAHGADMSKSIDLVWNRLA
jgi:hypothetical protein